MKEKEKICSFCEGKKENPNNFREGLIKNIMIEENCCFSCAFWKSKIKQWKDDKNWVVIDGTSYHIQSSVPEGTFNKNMNFLGHGGSKFFIKRNDNTVIYSNNVWCQGDIPEHFKNLIPNNAVFITKEEYNNLINKNG